MDRSSVLPVDVTFNHNLGKLRSVCEESVRDPEKFYSSIAEILTWYRKWDTVLDRSSEPFYRWYVGGKVNVCYNALDRHVYGGKRNKAAFIFVGENGEEKIVTYHGLLKRVNSLSKTLKELGVSKGDRIAIYMPMILETVVTMLACARIGAVFTVVFSGFGAGALSERINDSHARILFTADGGYRNGKIIPLKEIADSALENCPAIDTVIVVRRTGKEVSMKENRDYWYSDIVSSNQETVEPEPMDSNDPLYILYTSGTTGKPKGIVHGNGGYAVWVANTMKWAFDPSENDRWWCAADIGWVTGHSYIVFAPLLLGLTSILYEGSFTYPKPDRIWETVEYYGVNILYTSPTAIRSLMRYGEKYPDSHDLSSLRALGTVGEPINPAAWNWYFNVIGHSRAPIIDTYWQTETGGFIIAPSLNLGLVDLKPGSATFPLPGIEAEVLREDGKKAETDEKGYLVVEKPWPGMMLGINNDPERYKSTYFSRFPGYYFTGDFCVRDRDSYLWILGRSDEVLKVSGHRIGTIEIEDSIVSTGYAIEAAVFGKPDTVKGEAIVSFVIPRKTPVNPGDLSAAIKQKIREDLGPITVPDEIHFVSSLPKTRSGKIMRRLIKAVYLNQIPGDISTLESEEPVEEIKEAINSFRKETGMLK